MAVVSHNTIQWLNKLLDDTHAAQKRRADERRELQLRIDALDLETAQAAGHAQDIQVLLNIAPRA